MRVQGSKSIQQLQASLWFLERVYHLPVVLHADDRPAAFHGLVPGLVEAADRRLAVVGPFALRVVVMDEPHVAGAISRRRPLQHLLVAVRIAEREIWAAADEAV